MPQQVPPYPQNPAHGNGTCEQCGEPCAVFGPRWCPACYDDASAELRAAHRAPKTQTPAEWVNSLLRPSYPSFSSEQPCPWQRAALQGLGLTSPAASAALAGLPGVKVQAFAVAAEQILRSIRQVRPELDLEPIKAWADAQALTSPEHDALHYLEVAYQAVVRGEPLPWLPTPSGLAPTVTRNESP
jgi:hypothetical protein